MLVILLRLDDLRRPEAAMAGALGGGDFDRGHSEISQVIVTLDVQQAWEFPRGSYTGEAAIAKPHLTMSHICGLPRASERLIKHVHFTHHNITQIYCGTFRDGQVHLG